MNYNTSDSENEDTANAKALRLHSTPVSGAQTTLEELSDDEIQIIEARIKNTFIVEVKTEPIEEGEINDQEVEAAVASIMDQPAQTLSWAEQVEAEVFQIWCRRNRLMMSRLLRSLLWLMRSLRRPLKPIPRHPRSIWRLQRCRLLNCQKLHQFSKGPLAKSLKLIIY